MLRSLSVMALSVLLGGCSGDSPPAAIPAPAQASASPADANTAQDSAGVKACDLLKHAVEEATLMQIGVVDAIRAASVPADAPVSDAAGRLAAAYGAAVQAQGSAGEPDAVAAVSAAGVEMSRTCTDAGLETVG